MATCKGGCLGYVHIGPLWCINETLSVKLCSCSQLSEQEFKERLVIEEGRLKSVLPSEPITGGGEAQAIGGLEQTGAIKSDCLHDGNDQTRMEEVAKQMAVIQYLRVRCNSWELLV